MADRDNQFSEIDGFASVLAVRHASRKTTRDAAPNASTTGKPPQQSIPTQGQPAEAPKGVTGRIARTILPERYEVACYECDYAFFMTGRLHETLCPKCRAHLMTGDYVIDKEWFQPVRTIGAVEIAQGGVLRGTDVVAGDVLLSGSSEFGGITAVRRLELMPTARFNISKLKVKDLIIRPGCDFILSQPVNCRNVEIEGRLNAIIFAEGWVVIRAGGVLQGEIDCAHLVVEEGGGLEAQVCAETRSSKPRSSAAGKSAVPYPHGTPGRN